MLKPVRQMCCRTQQMWKSFFFEHCPLNSKSCSMWPKKGKLTRSREWRFLYRRNFQFMFNIHYVELDVNMHFMRPRPGVSCFILCTPHWHCIFMFVSPDLLFQFNFRKTIGKSVSCGWLFLVRGTISISWLLAISIDDAGRSVCIHFILYLLIQFGLKPKLSCLCIFSTR